MFLIVIRSIDQFHLSTLIANAKLSLREGIEDIWTSDPASIIFEPD